MIVVIVVQLDPTVPFVAYYIERIPLIEIDLIY